MRAKASTFFGVMVMAGYPGSASGGPECKLVPAIHAFHRFR